MNFPETIYRHYAYIGNRTDGSSTCGFGDPRGYLTQHCPHPHPGILIDDIADPAHPTGVGEIGLPNAGQVGITTRELRVWPQKHLLMVMTFRCSSVIHACPLGNDTTFPFDIKFFDLTDPVHPAFISSYVPTSVAGQRVKPHEMFLWVDPKNPDRALLWLSTPSVSVNPARPNLMIVDISDVPAGTVESLSDKLLTPVPFPTWGTGPHCDGHTAAGCAESHSAVPLPGRPFALTIDEVYGTFTVPSFGWPWGWARLWNIAQPRRPHVLGQYKILHNTTAYTPAPGEDEFTSYSSHNPTQTRNLIFDSWHSGGEQAIDVSDPGHPLQAGWFSPTPLATVANEDPALSAGPNKVVVWSFPIIRNGLIYVIDIRNGLYVLRYTGPRADEAANSSFLEGNSNLGDAGRLAKSAAP